jgi:kynureninase
MTSPTRAATSGGPRREDAEALDRDDSLAHYRDEFVVDDDSLVYLDGNSLGRLTRASRDRVMQVLVDDWGSNLIRSWDERWLDLPTRLGDLIGTTLLGASPGEVIVGDTTTVSLYKAVAAALDARRGRTCLVIERDNFPTDRYVVESLAAQRGLEVRWVGEAGTDGVTPSHLAAVLDDTVAVVVLSHVDYRSAALADMTTLTGQAHEAGALSVWDLCHSVGVVPIDLTAAGADLAVGCTYKYLNGGPGAPAFTYVTRSLRPLLRQPIWGWWGRADMFDMAQGYRPYDDIRSWLTGTPAVLSMAAVEPAVSMIAAAGIGSIRAKSVALTEYAVLLYDGLLAPLGFGLASPRDPRRRGGHVTVTRADARRLTVDLTAAGVIPDFRRPDGIRIGLAPLTTRFVDVFDGFAAIARLAAAAGAADLRTVATGR